MSREIAQLSVRERAHVARDAEPLTTGVPLPRGRVKSDARFSLRTRGGKNLPVQSEILSRWPDGSIQWLLCHFEIALEAGEHQHLSLVEAYEQSSESLGARRASKGIPVGDAVVHLGEGPLMRLSWSSGAAESRRITLTLELSDGSSAQAYVDRVETLRNGSIHQAYKLTGAFRSGGKHLAGFSAEVKSWAGTPGVQLDVALTHTGRARHRGGCWDLDDEWSLNVRSLKLRCPFASGEWASYSTDQGKHFSQGSEVRIDQPSSGGERWNYKTHCDGDGVVRLAGPESRIFVDGEESAGPRRADGVVVAGSGEQHLALGMHGFWQNAPNTMGATGSEAWIDLFPAPTERGIELQGGERKTHRLWLLAGGEPGLMYERLNPVGVGPTPQTVRASGIFPAMPKDAGKHAFSELIRGVLEGPNSFFAKREIIEEYGWRNFGELYADHEAVRSSPDEPHVSHYNNQYDPIYSFVKQYLFEADDRWWELADDLTRHVRDIDLYHTQEDRDEYCKGMFWHTDHYLDAATGTHRSYSAKHAAEKSQVGGGPALEHCYAQGFAYHYFLTGERASYDAVLGLADWVIRVNRGPGTLLGSLHQFKQYLPMIVSGVRGHPVHMYKYPFNRASGNSLNTLLDALLVSGDARYLKEAEHLICHCAGPQDDIKGRDLLNAELGWSYTVFMQALGRYLDAKRSRGDLDEMFHYGRLTFLHYARWMVENEFHYLDQIENLEFPNETWPAQDLRVARVLLHASVYVQDDESETFRRKGLAYFEKAIEQLYTFERRTLTRPVILLLQNYELYCHMAEGRPLDRTHALTNGLNVDTLNARLSAGKLLREQFKYAWSHTSLGDELRWLRSRIQNVSK